MQTKDYSHVPLWRRDNSIAAHALVDDADMDRVAVLRWFRDSSGYARANSPTGHIIMHRFLWGLAPGDPRRLDHISRDRLDNRRANLRLVTHAENLQNMTATRGCTSRFRGVRWASNRGRWVARHRSVGKSGHIGYFDSEVEAAFAAEAWRRQHMPYAEPDPELLLIVALAQRYLAF